MVTGGAPPASPEALSAESQRQVALALQHAVIGSRREIPGVQAASRYYPAARGAGVGGDWFDLIPLGGGRAGVIIGDVTGRGLAAATAMAQLRAAANALARTGMAPVQVMQALDAAAADLPGQLATCCYLLINVFAGELTGCSAGHLPVLLARPRGGVCRLPLPVSVPLGVGGIPHQQATVAVPHGSALLLYTDGLLGDTGDVDDRFAALEAAFRAACAATASLEQAADRVLSALLPRSSGPADDVTVLLARMPPGPLASARTVLRPEPRQVAAGRQFTARTLACWGQPHVAGTACLLVSEILTNAVRNARQPVSLNLYLTEREVVAEIADDCAHPPQRLAPELAEENGRGLMIVEALASTWGTRPAGAGKVVWFTLAARSSSQVSGQPS